MKKPVYPLLEQAFRQQGPARVLPSYKATARKAAYGDIQLHFSMPYSVSTCGQYSRGRASNDRGFSAVTTCRECRGSPTQKASILGLRECRACRFVVKTVAKWPARFNRLII
jgi:hypothetical protein